ncbi:unnamed protein product [Sympodiomycopsis kandeliae]
MTVSHRKTKASAKPDDRTAAEPGVQYHCDVCEADITLTVRIRCAGGCKEFDLCGSCFCAGAEAKQHKAYHAYRIVEQHAYPIFADDWGADEELLLIDGCQQYGLGNWADIADHIGNRSKEEVEAHYVQVFVEGKDGTEQGEKRALAMDEADTADPLRTSRQLPVRGPNMQYASKISADSFHQAKRQRISDLRSRQAALPIGPQKGAPPKPLVSAPTSHHELSGFMAGRLEFETEFEQEAETLTKDMEFGKVYRFGGELLPSEEQALGGKAVAGRSRMEASGRGGASARGTGGNGSKGTSKEGDADDDKSQIQSQKDAESTNGDEDNTQDVDDTEKNEEDDEDKEQTNSTTDTKADPDDEAAAADSALPLSTAVESKEQTTSEPSERPPADWDEDPTDCDLKLMILGMYNERLERRTERKRAILERGLVEVRRRQAAERRRPKEERDLLNRIRHFAPMATPQDFEEFLDGLCYQDALQRVFWQLQEYRRAGLHNLTDAAKYEAEKAERLKQAQQMAEEEYGGPLPASLAGGLAMSNVPAIAAAASSASGAKRGPSVARRAGRESETPLGDDDGASSILAGPSSKSSGAAATANATQPPSATAATTNGKDSSSSKKDKNGEPKSPRKPPRPLDLSSHPSLHLLTRPEQVLCSVQRIQPSAFLVMKKEILTEFIRRSGRMSRRETRVLFKMDVNKIGKVYDLLEEQGYLTAAKAVGWDGGEGGVGTPPGWKDQTPSSGTEMVNGVAAQSSVNGQSTNGATGSLLSVNGHRGGPARPGSARATPTPGPTDRGTTPGQSPLSSRLTNNGKSTNGQDNGNSNGNSNAAPRGSPFRPTAAV